MAINLRETQPALRAGADISTTGSLNVTNVTATGTLNVTGVATFSGGIVNTIPTIGGHSAKTVVNSTGAVTGAQVATGYITSTSASPTTITMPTGTDLGGVLGASQGTTFELYVDNTAGASTVTMAVGTNGVQSDWDLQVTAATASVTPAAITPLTVRSGVAGTARYTIVFSSATAYTFSRSA